MKPDLVKKIIEFTIDKLKTSHFTVDEIIIPGYTANEILSNVRYMLGDKVGILKVQTEMGSDIHPTITGINIEKANAFIKHFRK